MKQVVPLLIFGITTFATLAPAQKVQEAPQAKESFLPTLVAEEDFSALKGQSPFLRSVNLSDSLILTGYATVDNEQVATLMNKDTKETFVVSSQLNSQGWKMVDLKADKDLEKVAAKVSIEGGEVVTVRYAEWQLKPGESKPGAGPSTEPGPGGGEGARPPDSDGRRGPSPEFREKMSQLSEEQRTQLFEKMRELRTKNPEMSREDGGKAMSEMMDKMLKEK